MGEVPLNHPCELDFPFLTIQLWGVPFVETSICDTKICFPTCAETGTLTFGQPMLRIIDEPLGQVIRLRNIVLHSFGKSTEND